MYKIIKRILDFLISLFALMVLIPVFILVICIIKASSRGPVFFKQKRIGKKKKTFTMLKFRTMRTDAPKDCPTHMLENPELYITKIGKFLRKTSLDELPQLINIFCGQMSIIGPRPALYNQDDLIAERDKFGANEVRPGLSGWAQINGRDELAIPDKARLDGDYVADFGFFMDVKCFFGTIKKVLKSDGVVEGGVGNLDNCEESNTDIPKNPIVTEDIEASEDN